MKQYVKTFWDRLGDIEAHLNEFLEANPNYEIYKVTMTEYDNNTFVRVLVVFKINPIEESYTVARGVTE